MIVKPLHEDGSLGISKESVVLMMRPLRRQIRYVIEKYHQPALVEEFIDGRELNVSLMETNGKVDVLPISEIDYSEFPTGMPKICGYEAKWVTDSIEFQRSKPICPASLDWVTKKKIEQTALRVFRSVRMPGLCQGGFPSRQRRKGLCLGSESESGYLSPIRDDTGH